MKKRNVSAYVEAFRDYGKKQGLDILPDDVKFIEKCIRKCPGTHRKAVLRNYFNKWAATLAKNVKGLSSQNLGRYRANSYLRDYVESIT